MITAQELADIRGRLVAHEMFIVATITLLSRDRSKLAEIADLAKSVFNELPIAAAFDAKAAAAEARRYIRVVEDLTGGLYSDEPDAPGEQSRT